MTTESNEKDQNGDKTMDLSKMLIVHTPRNTDGSFVQGASDHPGAVGECPTCGPRVVYGPQSW